jgi:hypothetical protein
MSNAIVKLQDVVNALEMRFDEYLQFLDLDTGDIAAVNRELPGEAEETEEEESEDDDEDGALAKRIAGSDQFVRLPMNYDVHEWQIMKDFALSQEGRLRSELLDALNGRGAYRHVKDTVRHQGVEEDWYRFRTDALREIAIEWCEGNHIAWK